MVPVTPLLAVDIIIRIGGPRRIVLIQRKNVPFGWAIPGGMVDVGETVEDAAAREALEETSLHVSGLRQFRVYSDPARDARGHSVSLVFLADAEGVPKAADDAAEAAIVSLDELPLPLAFDHARILDDYTRWLESGGKKNGLLFEPHR